MFIVYAIKSVINGRIYVGQTDNIERRLKQHNDGHCISTRSDLPWRVCDIEKFETRSEARWCERQLKRSRGRRLKWFDTHKV